MTRSRKQTANYTIDLESVEVNTARTKLVNSFVIASSAEQSIISKLHSSNSTGLKEDNAAARKPRERKSANWSSITLVNGAIIINVAPVFSQLFSRENA